MLNLLYRARKLEVPFYHTRDKLKKATELFNILDYFYWDNVAFFGDDLPDLELMQHAHYVGCPANAHFDIHVAVDVADTDGRVGYQTRVKGGNGAFREFAEWLIGQTAIGVK